jgi:hypothetical protein
LCQYFNLKKIILVSGERGATASKIKTEIVYKLKLLKKKTQSAFLLLHLEIKIALCKNPQPILRSRVQRLRCKNLQRPPRLAYKNIFFCYEKRFSLLQRWTPFSESVTRFIFFYMIM